MSDIWPHVTKNDPCPICGKPDWCCLGDRKVKCMRVESEHACPSGGWYHDYPDAPTRRQFSKVKATPPPPKINATQMMREWTESTTMAQRYSLASSLGVLVESVVALRAAWAPSHMAWAFPMFDGWGEPVGIRLRSMDARKWAVPGSRQGIFLPHDSVPVLKEAMICEGPTSTMAALSLGFYGIGRASCNCSADQLKVALNRLGIKRAIIVADNDRAELANGKEFYPGLAGVEKLKRELKIPTLVWIPPLKDIRKFVQAGGTRAMVDSDLKNLIWKRGIL